MTATPRLGLAPLTEVVAVWVDEGGPVAGWAGDLLGLGGAGVPLDGIQCDPAGGSRRPTPASGRPWTGSRRCAVVSAMPPSRMPVAVVAGDDLYSAVSGQPRLDDAGVPAGQDIDPAAAVRIDQDGRVDLPPPQREVIDPPGLIQPVRQTFGRVQRRDPEPSTRTATVST
ncbi:hypothetical protein ET495_14165 [Xylanimonas allomyrinae]|uniref:Uncharacterized protein n=1 Tax=Xylanimonas allomyrinae TaxID=2509459 RepID=A0A4P6ENA0_9MICO|nr:hypothetical protein [Xylanimonas allomyrinae]QAY64174.1 hypothetical protein ET495_14165 [Xylanimonas allomyrinae]